MRLFLGKNSFLPLDKVYFAGLMCTHLAAFRTAANIRKQGMALPLQKGRRPSVPKGTTLYLITWTSPMTKRRFCRMSALPPGKGKSPPWWVPPTRAKALVPGWQPGCGMSPEARSGWMGWCFTTSFWAEKKQETFFRFPARCAAGRRLVFSFESSGQDVPINCVLSNSFGQQMQIHI